MIPNKLKIPALIALVIAIGLFLRRCNVDPVTNPSDVKLETNDQAKVIVDKNKITVVKRDKDGNVKAETKYIPDHATVTYHKDGTVEFKVKTIGLQFEPGIGTLLYDKGSALSLNVQFAYYRRIGFIGGLGVQLAKNPAVVPFVAVGYRLPWEMVSNTSVMFGYAPVQKSPVLGLRIRF